mmetsp:Transcript_12321/g.23049  ORF Transcript_12321/g.23049 Transcript_12321/m.23049 type:complete len:371 (+) Transcript_12321:130-1242(+)
MCRIAVVVLTSLAYAIHGHQTSQEEESIGECAVLSSEERFRSERVMLQHVQKDKKKVQALVERNAILLDMQEHASADPQPDASAALPLVDVPASIVQLATELFNETQSKEVLSKAVVKKARLNGKTFTLHAYSGDDALQRLPDEFAGDVYGVSRLLSESGSDPVIDIGANLGSFSIAAYNLNPKLRILALEPMPVTYLFLRWNLEANGVPVLTENEFYYGWTPGVLAMNSGATADGRTINLQYDPAKSENAVTSASGAGSNIPPGAVMTGHEVGKTALSVNVAKWCQDMGVSALTFFKIDCEGCEHEVVPTVLELLKDSKHVAGEVHPCLETHACFYPPEVVSSTVNFLCDVGHCCTPPGATTSQACSSP